MKPILLVLAPLALTAAAATAVRQDFPAPPERTEQHAWLSQLVGEWDVVSEMTVAPGAEPMRLESTESVRSIGGLWILGEGNAELGETRVTSLMTLGYDPEVGSFVGTWVDTMHTHLWTYTGQLDAAGKVLTLEAEGPSFEDPGKTARYRDAIEIAAPDKKVLTSSVQAPDGSWTSFMRAEYVRRVSGQPSSAR